MADEVRGGGIDVSAYFGDLWCVSMQRLAGQLRFRWQPECHNVTAFSTMSSARTGVAHCCGFWLRSAVRHEGWFIVTGLDVHGQRAKPCHCMLIHAVSRQLVSGKPWRGDCFCRNEINVAIAWPFLLERKKCVCRLRAAFLSSAFRCNPKRGKILDTQKGMKGKRGKSRVPKTLP